MLKRILVGLGGTEYTVTAIKQAVALAIAHDAEVTGVSIIDEGRLTYSGPVPIGGGHYAHELANDRLEKAKERGEWAVQQFTEACRAPGVRHQVLREEGEPFSVMIDQARYHDLLIFSLRSLFEFDLVPDPHDALVRLVQAGVRPLIAVSKEFSSVQKVLIAYSGSMESARPTTDGRRSAHHGGLGRPRWDDLAGRTAVGGIRLAVERRVVGEHDSHPEMQHLARERAWFCASTEDT